MAPTQNDEKPKAGDLIEIFRPTYQHWAVYVGDGFIVHITLASDVAGSSANSMMSAGGEKAVVKKEKLSDVVGKHKWRINNYLDKKHDPHPAQVIVKKAEAKVGEEMKYSVIRGNCEHFATEMRYGKAESRQVRKAEETVSVVSSVIAFIGGAAAVTVGIVRLLVGSRT